MLSRVINSIKGELLDLPLIPVDDLAKKGASGCLSVDNASKREAKSAIVDRDWALVGAPNR